ncbi:MAG: hypothetical protein HQL97_05250, partial [Magnetococcales bacterium]|nr:hypothetical protein [Magnetococcales bacterium]
MSQPDSHNKHAIRQAAPLPHLDVVTTATLRPELLDITYLSFTSKLLAKFPSRRLIINIDPIGEPRATLEQMLEVCHRHFDQVIYRYPDTPSFARAVHWAWQQVES